jgi:hypothetical protein
VSRIPLANWLPWSLAAIACSTVSFALLINSLTNWCACSAASCVVRITHFPIMSNDLAFSIVLMIGAAVSIFPSYFVYVGPNRSLISRTALASPLLYLWLLSTDSCIRKMKIEKSSLKYSFCSATSALYSAESGTLYGTKNPNFLTGKSNLPPQRNKLCSPNLSHDETRSQVQPQRHHNIQLRKRSDIFSTHVLHM